MREGESALSLCSTWESRTPHLAWAAQRSWPCWPRSRRANGQTNSASTQAQIQGTDLATHIYPIYEVLDQVNETSPADLKLQCLHDTGQQDIWEESCWGSGIDSSRIQRPWTRPMTHCSEHLQVKLFRQKEVHCVPQWHTAASTMRFCLL